MRSLEHTIENNIKKTENLQTSQNNTTTTIRNTAQNLNAIVNDFAENQNKFSSIMEDYSRLTHERLSHLEDFNSDLKVKIKMNSSKTELVPVGKDSIMVKTKRDE